MKIKMKVLMISGVLVISFGIWINCVGLANSSFNFSVNCMMDFMEAQKRLPESIAELERFHEQNIPGLKINSVDIDKVITKDRKLYLNDKRVWLVKPSGRYVLLGNVLVPAMTREYSYDIYEKYKEMTRN